MSSLRQGPDKLFQDFISRLIQTSNWLIGDTEIGHLVRKQLALESASAICKAAFRPIRRKSNIVYYIQICSDIGHSYTWELAIGAAL